MASRVEKPKEASASSGGEAATGVPSPGTSQPLAADPLDHKPTDPSAPATPAEPETDPSHPSLKREAPDRRPTDPSESSAWSAEASQRAPTAVSRSSGPHRRDGDPALVRVGAPAPTADGTDEHVGKIFGEKYRVERLIAKGGMGRVYRATQFPLERPVAIKILNAEFQRSDPQFVRRFFLEASTAAKLSHPHTITVFDYGEGPSGELYIAMEYLRGRPLSRVVARDGPFDAESAIRISLQICRALREAHAFGVIHRDLKPGNVMLMESREEGHYAKVLDFGLVKLFTPEDAANLGASNMLGPEGDLTRTGTLLGSPKYMSPEQIQGMALDPRTDIYSFGVILYQMVSGKPPFSGATGVDVIYKHVNHPVPPIASANPEVECPPELEDIVQRCLRKDREERYASMDELIEHLKEALTLIGSHSGPSESHSVREASLRPARSAEPMQREASFREHIAPDEPTPTGAVASEALVSPSSAMRPSRVPLTVAALGFVVALATLGYVVFYASSNRDADTPKVPPVAPSQSAPVPAIATPPPASLPPAQAAPPPVAEPPPASVAAPAGATATEVAPDEAEEDKASRRTAKKPTKKKKVGSKADRGADEADTSEADPDIPPAYRDNPY